MFELSIVIPTYNEKDNIRILVDAIAEAFRGVSYEVVVVDDMSPDGTGDVVRQMETEGKPVRLLAKQKKEGMGAALRAGYQSCNTPLLASSDADLSFDPKDLRKLYEAVKGGNDLVVGSRHSRGSFYETPNRTIWTKHLVSLLGNITLRTLTGIPLQDFSGNFRVFTKRMWDAIETKENTNTLLFEMILKAYVQGFTVAQIPVAFHDRRYGASKLKLSWEAPKFLIKLVAYLWQFRAPLLKRRFG